MSALGIWALWGPQHCDGSNGVVQKTTPFMISGEQRDRKTGRRTRQRLVSCSLPEDSIASQGIS